MNLFISFFILAIFPISTLSFTCNQIQNPSSCNYLVGCTWTDDNCMGEFFHSCNAPTTCYYIDPIDGSDTQSGSLHAPFKTLTYVLKSFQGKDATLIIINREPAMKLQLLSQITIDSSITIKPLLGDDYIISLETFNLQTLQTKDSAAAVYIRKGKLEIINANFDETSSIKGLQTIFHLGDAQLSLHHVFIGRQKLPINIVHSTGQLSQFNFTNSALIYSSFTFRFEGGLHYFSDIILLNNRASNALITLNQSDLTLNRTTVHYGESLFIQADNQSTLRIQDLAWDEYKGNFLKAQDPSFIFIINSAFKDLNLNQQSESFIYITGKTFRPSNTHVFENITFQNINLQSSIFFIDKRLSAVHLTGINMSDIKKQLVLESLPESSRAACLVAIKDVSVSIEKSNFQNLDSNCIYLESSTLTLRENIFNNTGLVDFINHEAANIYRGVTWVSIHDGTNNIAPGYIVRITENQFIENKILPFRGGALRVTGQYPVNFELKDNIFMKNIAEISGAAIYSENFYASFTIENGEFIENFARLGGIIHTINEESDKDENRFIVELKGVKFTRNRFSSGSLLDVRDDKLKMEDVKFEENVQERTIGGRRGISFDEL